MILVDDGSTDESLNICKKYEKVDYRVKIINKENGGLSSARNAGIEVACGAFICFIDSDDFLEQNYVDELVGGFRLHQDNDVDLVACNYYYNETEERKCHRTYKCDSEIRDRVSTMIEIASPKSFKGFAWNKLYRLEIIKKNNLVYDENAVLVEDALFCHQYMRCASNSFYIDKPLYHYIQRQGSLLHSTFNRHKLCVLPSYRKIISICGQEQSVELDRMLKENYLSQVITLMKMIMHNSEAKERYYKELKSIIKTYWRQIIFAHNISTKRKILVLYMLFR